MESPLKNNIKRIYNFLNQGDEGTKTAYEYMIFIMIIMILGLLASFYLPK